jgi:hypothetical protein
MALLSAGGTLIDAMTGSASTLPRAEINATISVLAGGSAASVNCLMASSTLSKVLSSQDDEPNAVTVTKLQGLCVLSNWVLSMPVQAVLQAPVEPGMQKINVRFANPAQHRDCMVEDPISSNDNCLNNSPNVSIGRSNKGRRASGVESLLVIPVPPVVRMTCTESSAIHFETIARIW